MTLSVSMMMLKIPASLAVLVPIALSYPVLLRAPRLLVDSLALEAALLTGLITSALVNQCLHLPYMAIPVLTAS
jgi:hypothetical protein